MNSHSPDPNPDPTPHNADHDQLRQGAQQMVDGAKHFATGAKTYFDDTLAPATKQAAVRAKSDFDAQSQDAGGILPLLTRYAPTALLVSTGVFFIGLLLPMYKSKNYLGLSTGDGVAVILLLLAVAALTVLNVRAGGAKKTLRIPTGVLAGIVGICGLYGGFGNIPNLGVSLGALVIGFAGFGLTIAALLTLINKKANS